MNVLFLTHRLPYPPNRGDRIRAFHLLRALGAFSKVSVLSLVHGDEEAGAVDALRAVVASLELAPVHVWPNRVRALLALPGPQSLTEVLLSSPDGPRGIARIVERARPDVVVSFCSGVAGAALRPPLDGVPFVLDMVDVDSEKWADLSRSATWPLRAIYGREATRLRHQERTLMADANLTMVVSPRERDAALAIAPSARVMTVPNGVDVAYFRARTAPETTADVVFCGVFDYPPNEMGAEWLATNVWPLVRARRPDARLLLVGMRPSAKVRALAHDPDVVVTGAVPDVRPYLWRAAAAVAPLSVARGIQNKVLEGLAAGVPCVLTPAVAGGVPETLLPGCVVAASPGAFAEAILRLLDMAPEQRRAMAASSAIDRLDWSVTFSSLEALLSGVARENRRPAASSLSSAGSGSTPSERL